ncbi:MAG: S8 family peptidase [Saprospiraceae bacterium]|jgi:serine protease AprX|nr:S8 family peptidase [Saprospiraceae bacterium]
MLHRAPLVAFLLACFSHLTAQVHVVAPEVQQKISPTLQRAFAGGEPADLLVVFREKSDLRAAAQVAGKTEKARFVYARLLETAERSQARARRILREHGAFANSFYLVNAIAVSKADAALAYMLAELPEVAALAPDPDVPMPLPEQRTTPGPVAERGAVEWGIEKINAPAVWAMGYTGQGITVAGADTGYEWDHRAIQPHYRGYDNFGGTADHNYNWHDAIHEISPLNNDSIPDPANNPCGLDSKVPCDDNNHGTHTMGTMVGDDGQGNQIGVAPGAQWIACRNMERGNGKPSSYIECFEWFLAPTDLNGQNADPAKAPHVVNNSWYCSTGEGCVDMTVDALLRQAVIALRTSGVVVVVSNGNSGSQGCGSTFGPPAYFEESFSIGATESTDTITGFSSRGPVTIDSSYRTKPNVVAPGAGIRSSVRNGGYAHFWGTSMAGPHVAGLVALVLSARPDLAGEVDLIEDIIEQTAIPAFDTLDCSDNSGQNYPNNTYGYGRVDALAAVLQALAVSPVRMPDATLAEVRVSPNPADEAVFFSIKNASGTVQVEVFGAAGQLLWSGLTDITHGEMRIAVPLQAAPTGVYFWKIQTAGSVLTGKFVRQ